MTRLFIVEVLKWRRSWVPVVALVAAAAGPLMFALALVIDGGTAAADRTFHTVFQFQALLVGGMMAAVLATEIFVSDTEADSWKVLLTAPVPRWQIFVVKTLVAVVGMVALNLFSALVMWLAVAMLPSTGTPHVLRWFEVLALNGLLLTALMPLYHLLALWARSFMVSVGIGIALTLAGAIMVNTKYVGLHPNAAGLVLGLVPMDGLHVPPAALGGPALWIGVAAACFVVFLAAGWLWFVRTDFK